MKLKKIVFIILILIMLQVLRIILKNIIFLFINKTLISDVIVSIIFMILISVTILFITKKRNFNLNILPKKFNFKYIILTILLIIFIAITFIIQEKTFYNILFLIYGAIITVIYEELIFRGYIYKKLTLLKDEKTAYLLSSILFGIWHFGYIDTIIWRSSLFFIDVNILKIMFYKFVTGLILGFIFGFFRKKCKNVYASMLIHSFINTFNK